VEGWSDYKPIPGISDREMVSPKGLYTVIKSEIPSYFTVENIEMINLWKNYHLMGLPFSGGWAEQPAIYMDVISVLENAWRQHSAQ